MSRNGTTSLVLQGIPASPGVAIGHAFVLAAQVPVHTGTTNATNEQINVAEELLRFHTAVETVVMELHHARKLAEAEGPTAVTIVDTFMQIVNEQMMHESIRNQISQSVSAEVSVAREFDVHRTMLYKATDPYLRSRVLDLDMVKERLIAALRNRTLRVSACINSIVIAPHITPQEMLQFKSTGTIGYVTEVGGINSHVCILARDMKYPAVIGIKGASDKIRNNDTIVIDGYSGTVVVDPDAELLEHYQKKLERAEEYRLKLETLSNVKTVTTDDREITLNANIDEPEQVDSAMMAGAEGIGLVRTEYLLMKLGRYPTTFEQAEWYRNIAQRAFPKPVTFRVFDVGGDKFREGIPHREDNPALGLRGIRFLLYRPDIFESQICAILRASVHRNVRLMLPMVSGVEEIDAALQKIAVCKDRLTAEGVEFDKHMPVGVMIETPAAAILADTLAQRADFISIGTNDLAQYTLATDRTNDLVAELFEPLHPAVLRLIQRTVQAANTYGKSVSVCGELAGHGFATGLLIGLGLRELSVAPQQLLEIKHRILSLNYEACTELVSHLMQCTSAADVYELLNTVNAKYGKDEFV